MLFGAVSMFITVLLLGAWIPHLLRLRIAGYASIVDVLCLAACLTLFGGTGTERMAALGAGIGITILLRSYRWWAGYERYELFNGTRQWMRYPSYIERQRRRALNVIKGVVA